MNGLLTTTRFQIRGLATLAVAALVLLGSARDAGATQKGTAAKVITSGIIACQAMGGTATVDSGFDTLSMDVPDPLMTMSCTGGQLDGWGCDGFGDYVKCGTIKLATTGTGGQLPTVDAVVLRPAGRPAADVIEVVEPPAVVVEETALVPDVVEETDGTPERGETAVVDASIVVNPEPVADATVADPPPVVVVATAPALQTTEAVVVTFADDEER